MKLEVKQEDQLTDDEHYAWWRIQSKVKQAIAKHQAGDRSYPEARRQATDYADRFGILIFWRHGFPKIAFYDDRTDITAWLLQLRPYSTATMHPAVEIARLQSEQISKTFVAEVERLVKSPACDASTMVNAIFVTALTNMADTFRVGNQRGFVKQVKTLSEV